MSDPGWSIGRRVDPPAGATIVQPSRATGPSGGLPRGPRRLRMTLTKLDPWSALKISFVFGLVALVVLLVAVSLLYGLIDAMGVLASLRKFLGTVDSHSSGPGITAWLGFGRIFLVTLVLGAIDVVLFSALATLGAFIYNVSSDVIGGLELTLTDRS